MADRVKYFLLGVLFLVVAGVIAYDRWNSAGESPEIAEASGDDTSGEFDLSVQPATRTEPAPPVNPNRQPQPPPEPGPANVQRTPAPLPDLPPGPVAPTPAPEDERKPEAKPLPKAEPKSEPDRTHVIRKGETLEAIAIKYYGTRDGIAWIVNANGLPNANRIFANQKLVIPARKEITKERGSGGAAATKTPAKIPARYTVKETDGDLYAICRHIYGSAPGARVSRIMELNHLWSANVKAGTVLILPPK